MSTGALSCLNSPLGSYTVEGQSFLNLCVQGQAVGWNVLPITAAMVQTFLPGQLWP